MSLRASEMAILKEIINDGSAKPPCINQTDYENLKKLINMAVGTSVIIHGAPKKLANIQEARNFG
jgi:hypothetical protein